MSVGIWHHWATVPLHPPPPPPHPSFLPCPNQVKQKEQNNSKISHTFLRNLFRHFYHIHNQWRHIMCLPICNLNTIEQILNQHSGTTTVITIVTNMYIFTIYNQKHISVQLTCTVGGYYFVAVVLTEWHCEQKEWMTLKHWVWRSKLDNTFKFWGYWKACFPINHKISHTRGALLYYWSNNFILFYLFIVVWVQKSIWCCYLWHELICN